MFNHDEARNFVLTFPGSDFNYLPCLSLIGSKNTKKIILTHIKQTTYHAYQLRLGLEQTTYHAYQLRLGLEQTTYHAYQKR